MFEDIEEIKIYRGTPFNITDNISFRVPTINEIIEVGEKGYFSFIYNFTAAPIDLAWQLAELDVNFWEIDDYELFIKYITPTLDKKYLQLIFGNKIDFKSMLYKTDEKTGELYLEQHTKEIRETYLNIDDKTRNKLMSQNKPLPTQTDIDEYTIVINKYVYSRMVQAIRMMHKLKRNNVIPKNRMAKEIYIEESKQKAEKNKDKEYKSMLYPIISFLVNKNDFKYNSTDVFDINIFVLMDSLKRIMNTINIDRLYTSGYSGFGINLKEIPKKQLDYLSDLSD